MVRSRYGDLSLHAGREVACNQGPSYSPRIGFCLLNELYDQISETYSHLLARFATHECSGPNLANDAGST